MHPRKILLIARRDYLAYVARRRFWISLLLSPAIILGFIFVPGLIQHFQGARDYAVVDHSGWVLKAAAQRIVARDYATLMELAGGAASAGTASALPPPLANIGPAAAKLGPKARKDLAQALAAGAPAPASGAAAGIWRQRERFVRWYHNLTPDAAAKISRNLAAARFYREPQTGSRQSLDQQITNGSLFAYFIIPRDPLAPDAHFIYASHNLTDTDLRNWFSEQVSEVVRERKIAQTGLSQQKIASIEAPVAFTSRLVTKHGAHQASAAEQKTALLLPLGFVYLLVFAILQIAQLLMLSNIEEKSNRIAEMLLASVSPADVMAGKTLGIAAVGITLVGSWLAIILGLLAAFGGNFGSGNIAGVIEGAITSWDIAWFLVYFTLGFLLYASVLGAIGAAVNNIQEAQPFMAPVLLMIMLPFILMYPVAKDPTAIWARVLSYVPPLTPFLMMNRLAAPPPLIDYVLTTALLAATVALALYASSRIFRIGLLNTGAPPRLKELLGWLRTPAGGKR